SNGLASDTASALKRRQRLLFVRVDVEDGCELGDLHQVVDPLGEMEQLDFAAFVSGGRIRSRLFTDSRTIHVTHATHIQDELFRSSVERVLNRISEGYPTFAKGDAAADFENISVFD